MPLWYLLDLFLHEVIYTHGKDTAICKYQEHTRGLSFLFINYYININRKYLDAHYHIFLVIGASEAATSKIKYTSFPKKDKTNKISTVCC